jgi:hypothetical protein
VRRGRPRGNPLAAAEGHAQGTGSTVTRADSGRRSAHAWEMNATERSLASRAAYGAIDGAAATLAMSSIMFAAQRAGWLGELPPRKITRFALRRTHSGTTSRQAKDGLGALAHLAFGAGAGSLFESAFTRGGLPSGSGPVAGAAFGAAVWLVSYGGWVPALGILPPPHRDQPRRQVGMLVAHLVYGVVLGALAERGSPAPRPWSPAPDLAEVPAPS